MVKSSVVRELRAVQRFAVSLPVHLNWRVAGRPDQQLQGRTRDVSTRGMFVLAPTGPSQGELLEFEIDMALDEFSPLMLVQGEGRVVRVERPSVPSSFTGFAVHNLCFKLCEPSEGEALPAGRRAQSAAAPKTVARIDERDLPRRLTIARRDAKAIPGLKES